MVNERTAKQVPARRVISILSSAALLLTLACEPEGSNPGEKADAGFRDAGVSTFEVGPGSGDAATAPSTQDSGADTLRGLWFSRSWGLVLEAAAGVVETYEMTSISCTPYAEFEYAGAQIPALGAEVHREGEELVLLIAGTAEIRATPLERLPSACENGGTPATDDAEFAFEVFWSTFNEMYASFDLRGVDWKQSYDAFADRIDATTRPEELFAVLCEMISPLDDPHASLSHGEQTCTKPLPDWLAMDSAGLMAALEEYVYGGDATRTANGAIAYRVLPENVGYVFIPSMGGYADSPQADVTVAEAALDEVVSAFADVEGVIVDVRFNGGGSDQISMLIADRFADQKRLGFSVRTRDGDSWTEERNYYVQPAGGVQLLKPAVVLTSEFTVSAAETFVLLMGELPHVTVMGDRTAGGLSNMMNRSLPNGMTFTLPLERNFAANGECYEGLGLTPDIVFAFEADAFAAGNDTMLDNAVAVLTGD